MVCARDPNCAACRSGASAVRGAIAAVIVALAVAMTPAPARADGDPASDVLVSQAAFIPSDAGVSATEAAELEALLSSAARHGYPARVALIASASDLGSVTELWRQPQNYADFLGLELSLAVHGTVLVVMPNGAGVYHPGVATVAARAALAQVTAHAGHGDLAAIALTAVQKLAAADGHVVRAPRAQPAPRREAPRSTGATTWLAIGIGAVLIALAWVASLRARPIRLGRRHVSPPRGG